MKRLRVAYWTRHLAALLGALFIASAGYGQDGVTELKRQLQEETDWRMRVQAALRLGKMQHPAARPALERALSDGSPSVRASVAAALQVHGDKRALPALRKLLTDESELVRRQATTAVRALEGPANGPSWLVEVGKVRVNERVSARALDTHVKRVARHNLSNVQGVVMNGPGAEGAAPEIPKLVFEGTLHELKERRQGSVFAVSAEVEFVITKMPEHLIKGRISGGATVHGEPWAPTKKEEIGRLRKEAVEAATESALRNAERAIRAATE